MCANPALLPRTRQRYGDQRSRQCVSRTKGTKVERVGVVGAGMMGAGIVEVCARAGSDVLVVEVSDDAVDAARRRLDESLTWGERSGKLSAAVRSQIVERIRFTL